MSILSGRRLAAVVVGFCAAVAGTVYANHGPGASGGGSQTISGETLKAGHFELSLREDYSQFQHFDEAAAVARAREGGDFDALSHGFITTLDGAYGVTDNFQVGASVGFFHGRDFVGASQEDDGTVNTGTANPTGLTDLVVMGKYRVLKGELGNLAVLLGVVLPTGKSDVVLSNRERLSPTDQPGSGRFGMPVGVGYSRFITSHLTIDASAMYTVRFEKDDFKVGDRVDAGLALAYRITDDIKRFPQMSVFAEFNNVYLFKDRAGGERDANSGSEALYFTPGLRVRFDKHLALTAAPSFPIYQAVNGDQGRVDFKFALTVSFSY